MRVVILLLLFVCSCRAGVVVNTVIVGGSGDLQASVLNAELANNSLPTGTVVVASAGEQIFIQQCTPGTYTEGAAISCIDCAAGTASSVTGATSSLTCQTCSAGGFSAAAASQCTSCAAGRFSTVTGAVAVDTCLSCPPNSNSASGADYVTKCACNERYFLPVNTLQPLDPKASVQFASWDALAASATVLDLPHLNCGAGGSRRLLGMQGWVS